MRRLALCSPSISRWTLAAAALLALAVPAVHAQGDPNQYPDSYNQQQQDPPDQAGRISALSGSVSVQPSGATDWGQAYPNLSIAPGDRIYTDQDGQAELQVGQTYLRIGPNTDITLIGIAPDSISWGLSQGSVHTHVFGLWQGQVLNFSTPNGDAQLAAPGELRIDALPDQNSTIVSSLTSNVTLTGANGFYQPLGNWQSISLYGSNPVYPSWLQPAAPDPLDQWSQQRDQQILNAASYRYVNPEVQGAADLDAYGDWAPDTDYGPMWFPRSTPADWQPYHYGHWVNRDPWGWVWVEDEPWGYAPFHYGRWVVYRGRWGWVPGPREVRPVWAPALVVFAGGVHAGGVSLSVWFPLGPGEAYRPWYRTSPRYIDRVNITNIRETRVVHVQKTYVNIVNVTNITYVNRQSGVTAMRPDDFASGRSARQVSVQVDRNQFNRGPIQPVDRPAPVTRQSFITRPVGRPVPVSTHEPVFINRQGMQITAKPGAPPVAPPQVHTAPPQRPLPGRVVVAPPQNSRFQNGSPQPRQPDNPRGNPGNMPNGNRPPQPNNGSPAQNQPPANNPARTPVGRPATPIQQQDQDRPRALPDRNTPQPQPEQTRPGQQPQPQQPAQQPRPNQPQPQPQPPTRPNQPQPEQSRPGQQPQQPQPQQAHPGQQPQPQQPQPPQPRPGQQPQPRPQDQARPNTPPNRDQKPNANKDQRDQKDKKPPKPEPKKDDKKTDK